MCSRPEQQRLHLGTSLNILSFLILKASDKLRDAGVQPTLKIFQESLNHYQIRAGGHSSRSRMRPVREYHLQRLLPNRSLMPAYLGTRDTRAIQTVPASLLSNLWLVGRATLTIRRRVLPGVLNSNWRGDQSEVPVTFSVEMENLAGLADTSTSSAGS